VRPVDHDVVCLGEADPRGEDGACVAHGDVVAEELARPYERRREVHGAEDDHPGRRHARLDEQRHAARAARSVLGDLDGAGAARVQHRAGLRPGDPVQLRMIVEPAVVGPMRHGRPARPAVVRLVPPGGAHEQRPAQQFGRAPGHPGEGHRLAPGGGRQPCRAHRRVRAHRCDQHLDDPAAGQTHREGVLVAVAETFKDRFAILQRLDAQVVHRPFDTAAGDRADGRAVAVDGEGGAGTARRAPADGHDGGDGEVPALLDPPVQLVGDVKHPALPRPRAGRGRAGSAGSGDVRRSRARPRWRSPPRRPRCRSRRCP